jgi:hypothetical protein
MNSAFPSQWVVLPVVGLFLLAAHLPSACQDRGDKEGVYARFPFRMDGGLVLLPVTYQGKQHSFGLDTGATHSVFDVSLLLGEPFETITAKTADGSSEMRSYARPQAELGGRPLTGYQRVVGFDLQKLRRVTGQDFFGLVGFDALDGRIVRLDFDRGEVLFLDDVPPGAGHAFSVTVEDGYPYVRASFAGAEQRFKIDTGQGGFGSGSLEKALFDKQVKAGTITVEVENRTETASGGGSARFGRSSSITMGPFEVKFPNLSESSDNRLGLNFWARFLVTFDFRRYKVYLSPGRRYKDPDVYDRSGLCVLLDGGRVIVDSLRDTACPAAKAGVREGDELLLVGGKRAKELSLWHVRRSFCEAGTTVDVVLQRAGREVSTKVELPGKATSGSK